MCVCVCVLEETREGVRNGGRECECWMREGESKYEREKDVCTV